MKRFKEYIENKGKWVKWADIPNKEDIIDNIESHSKYLQDNRYSLKDWLDDEIFYLYVSNKTLAPLYNYVKNNRSYSKLNVKKLTDKLKNINDLDPILVDGNKFVDGGHRVFVYNKLKRKTIPTVDIGKLLRIDWEKFFDDKENIPMR